MLALSSPLSGVWALGMPTELGQELTQPLLISVVRAGGEELGPPRVSGEVSGWVGFPYVGDHISLVNLDLCLPCLLRRPGR